MATSPPKGGIPQNASSYAAVIPLRNFYRDWHYASLKLTNSSSKKDSIMDRKKIDKAFLDSLTLESSMSEILELTETFKYDLIKAKRDSEKSGKYTVSCLFRVRQLLIDLEKLGSQFRKLSIAYEKDLEKKKKTK